MRKTTKFLKVRWTVETHDGNFVMGNLTLSDNSSYIWQEMGSAIGKEVNRYLELKAHRLKEVENAKQIGKTEKIHERGST